MTATTHSTRNAPIGRPKLLWSGISMTIEEITPPVAKAMLMHNKCNRRLRETAVQKYTADMLNGDWRQRLSPICFDENGNLGNGQHTLSAIVKSDTTQTLLIARNVPRAVIASLDIGLSRTISDVSAFLEKDVDRRRAAVARILVYGLNKQTSQISMDQVFRAYEKHEEAIESVIKMAGTNRGVINAVLIAVATRAWYTCDRARLQEFFQVMRTGIVNSTDDLAALRYRDFALSGGAVSSADRIALYQKAQSALRAFLKREPLQKIYETNVEQFTIPSD